MRHNWNLQNMNEYCKEQNNGYKVIDIKWVQKSYQKQQWALVKCPNENHEPYWVWWNNFLHGNLCKKCDYEINNKTIWTKEKIIKFYSKFKLKILNINDWENIDTGIYCFNKDNFIVKSSITNLKNNKNPLVFCYNNKYTLYNIKLYCKLYRPEYEILSTTYNKMKDTYKWIYKGKDLPIDIDHIFYQTADNFINGGCGHPYFSILKYQGNRILEQNLIKNNIEYEKEKTFKGCKYKKLLRFDFYIPKINEVIEVDGRQHFEAIDYFGGQQEFEKYKIRDNIKNEYCKNHNINIIRIPYSPSKIKEYIKAINKLINDILQLNNIEKSKEAS